MRTWNIRDIDHGRTRIHSNRWTYVMYRQASVETFERGTVHSHIDVQLPVSQDENGAVELLLLLNL